MRKNSPKAWNAGGEELMEKKCYTVEEVQEILRASRGYVYKLIQKNEFRWFRVGRKLRINKESFDEWFQGL